VNVNERALRPDHDPKTYAVIGAAIEVHKQLGCGFLEAVYHEAMALELAEQGIPFEREQELSVEYKGKRLNVVYRADFICYGTVIVEFKALSRLTGVEEAQILNYMKATGLETGILINFGAKSLETRRFTLAPRPASR
jgi:GxxExxY protein